MVRSDGYVVLDLVSVDGAGETGEQSSKIFNYGLLVHPLSIRRAPNSSKIVHDVSGER